MGSGGVAGQQKMSELQSELQILRSKAETVTELQRELQILRSNTETVTDLQKRVADLEETEKANKTLLDTIEKFKTQIETLQSDAIKEKQITAEKERKYRKEVSDLKSKINKLEQELAQKTQALSDLESTSAPSVTGAQVAAELMENLSTNEHEEKTPRTSREVKVEMKVTTSDQRKWKF